MDELPDPTYVLSLLERVDRLELENQRLRELISDLADDNARLRRPRRWSGVANL